MTCSSLLGDRLLCLVAVHVEWRDRPGDGQRAFRRMGVSFRSWRIRQEQGLGFA